MNNVNGILLIVASMAFFTLEDIFIKQLSSAVATGQILMVLGICCSVIFLVMAVAGRKRVFLREAWAPLPLLRAASEAVGALFFVTALSLVDLSTVAAVFQVLPLTITMGAALFMGEQVGWRRWLAILVGLIGVLMIIRPGFEGFEPNSLYVVATVIAIAARDLITRVIDARVPSVVVASQAYLGLIFAGGALMLFMGQPVAPLQSAQVGPYIGAVVFGVLGYYGIVAAMRIGEASAVTPFRYTRLVFSILAGMLVFGEQPDFWTLAGASLIIGSGLFTFFRERKLARARALALT